jgi:site-specific recombinase XerD
LGWDLPFVQRCLGRRSIATTERVYRHITSGEYRQARSVEHAWPGL